MNPENLFKDGAECCDHENINENEDRFRNCNYEHNGEMFNACCNRRESKVNMAISINEQFSENRDHKQSWKNDNLNKNENQSWRNRESSTRREKPMEFNVDCKNNSYGNSKNCITLSNVSLCEILPEKRVVIFPAQISHEDNVESPHQKRDNETTKNETRVKFPTPVFGVFFTTDYNELKKLGGKKIDDREKHAENLDRHEENKIHRQYKNEGNQSGPHFYYTPSTSLHHEYYNNNTSNMMRMPHYNIKDYERNHYYPHDPEEYYSDSSSTSMPSPQEYCVICAENKKFASNPRNDRYDCYVANHCAIDSYNLPSSHYFDRLTSTCRDDFDRPIASTCTICSRRCTASNASLFVETGGSVADIHNSRTLSSARVLQFRDGSVDSLRNDFERSAGYTAVRRENVKIRSKSRLQKDSDTGGAKKCNVHCKTRPGAIERSYSDEFPTGETSFDGRTIRRGKQGSSESYGQQLEETSSNNTVESEREYRNHARSKSSANKIVSDNPKTRDTSDHSFWSSAQRGKLWSQLQNTCKSVLKLATTSIGQIVKASTRPSRLKEKSGDSFADRTNRGYKTWRNSTIHEQHQRQDCRSAIRASCEDVHVTEQPERHTQRYYGSDCHRHYRDMREQTPSDRICYFDPREVGIHEDVYPQSAGRGPPKGRQRPKYLETRKRGGSDGNPGYPGQRRRSTNPNPRPGSSSYGQPPTMYNRASTSLRNSHQGRWKPTPAIPEDRNQRSRYQQSKFARTYEIQRERVRTYIDVCVQVSSIHANMQPTNIPPTKPNGQEKEQVESVEQIEEQPDAVPDTPQNETVAPPTTGDGVSKWSSSSAHDVDSMVEDLSAKQETKTPKTENGTLSKRGDSKLWMEQGRTSLNGSAGQGRTSLSGPTAQGRTSLSGAANSKSVKDNGKKDNGSSKKPDLPVTLEEVTSERGMQCEIIQRQQIICTDDRTKDIPVKVERACFCTPLDTTGPPIALESQEETEDVTTDDSIVTIIPQEETKTEDLLGEETSEIEPDETEETLDVSAEEPSEKSEVSGEFTTDMELETDVEDPATAKPIEVTTDTVQEDADASSTVDEPETETDTPLLEEDTPQDIAEESIVDEVQTKEDAIVPETSTDDKTIDVTAPDQSCGPIEVTRECNGNRTYVNVNMQTSNTILTKILSEFEDGKKRKRVLMSIKLQNASDHDSSDEHGQGSKDMEVQTTKLHVASAVTNQWAGPAEYSLNTVTTAAGMEITGQTQQNDRTKYLGPPANTRRQNLTRDGSIRSTQRRRRKINVAKAATLRSRKSGNIYDETVCTNVGSSISNSMHNDITYQHAGRNGRPVIEGSSNTDTGSSVRSSLGSKNICGGPCGRKKPPRF